MRTIRAVDSGADDYLGIVSDRVVEVAPPGITGGGDLEIDAAIYAGRRFVVTAIDHPRICDAAHLRQSRCGNDFGDRAALRNQDRL